MSRNFAAYLPAEVQRISKREQITEAAAFMFWFATDNLELSDTDAREAVSLDGANDKGIDLFWKDDDAGRVIVAQGKYSPALAVKAKESHVSILESSLNWLENPEALRREGKADLAQAAEDCRSRRVASDRAVREKVLVAARPSPLGRATRWRRRRCSGASLPVRLSNRQGGSIRIVEKVPVRPGRVSI